MKYSVINKTGLKAGKIVLGTDRMGTAVSLNDSFKLLDTFCEYGGNMLDTASVYADWLSCEKSESEKTIGKWLKERKNRENVIIATKGGHHDLKTGEKRIDIENVRHDFENSLKNLNTDYIDIYYLHKDDVEKSPKEMIEILNEATDERARFFGVSNWSYARIKEANDWAEKKGLRPIVASQIQYSIAKTVSSPNDIYAMTEKEYENYCQDDLSLFAFSSQARGFFAFLEKGGEEALNPALKRDFLCDENIFLFEKLQKLAKEKGTDASILSIAALICDRKLNTFAQIGTKNLSRLISTLAAAEISLSQEEIDFLLVK